MSSDSTRMRRVDDHPIPETTSEIRLVTQVRDEMLRLPFFLEHHRRTGVGRFFVIDNGSEDGTLDYLKAQPDVHVFHTTEPYREKRRQWKQQILDRHCRGSWTLHLDADELFVFPQVERVGLEQLCRFLEQEGARGMHATMVDMYGEGAIHEAIYEPGTPPLGVCPWFDGEGYWLYHQPRYKLKRLDRAPSFSVRGGPRHRLFYRPERPPRGWEERLAAWLYDIRRSAPPVFNRWRPAFRLMRRVTSRAAPHRVPWMSKVPLLRWGADLRLEDLAFHYVTPAVPLSACWGGILHFKYLHDFASRVDEAVERKQHLDSAVQYRRYQAGLREEPALSAWGPRSRRYESSASLVDAGLMRSSEDYETFVRSSSATSPDR